MYPHYTTKKLLETLPGMGKWRIRRMLEWVNATMKHMQYCKFLKLHNVPPAQQ
jgi:hypothetical protein